MHVQQSQIMQCLPAQLHQFFSGVLGLLAKQEQLGAEGGSPAEYLATSWLPMRTCEKLMLTSSSPRPTLAGTSGRQLENQPCIWSNEKLPVGQSVSQSISQSINQSVNQSEVQREAPCDSSSSSGPLS